MKQAGLGRFLIASSAVAVATLFSVGWSDGGVSLSVDKAQARRLYVSPHYGSPYYPGATGLPWYAVRAYYADGPWCGVGSAAGYGTGVGYSTWGGSWSCYSSWADYKQRNGIGCDPGTVIKGGDGILYVCQ
jgi:hypothetical protein